MTGFPPQGEGLRFYTVEEADSAIPALELEFGRIARARSELGPLIEAVGGADAAVAILRLGAEAPPGRQAEADRLVRVAGEVTAAIERVNALGCLVKDVDAGLVDFYSLRDGEPVFLCWQFGERAVTHWHGVDQGFAGRQPLEGAAAPEPAWRN